MFGLLKTFYIKPNERGLLFYRSHFQGVLLPGTHHRMGWHWNVSVYDLNKPQVEIANTELLLQLHGDALSEQFVVVRTSFNQAALVRMGQQWVSIGPNQLQLFWRGFIEVEAHLFNLDDGAEIPAEFIQPLTNAWAQNQLSGVRIDPVAESKIGMLYVDDNFIRPLEPGTYGFWTFNQLVRVYLFDRTKPDPVFQFEDVLTEQHPEFVATYCEVVALGAQEVAIARHKGKVIAVLPPTSRKLFWKGVTVEVIDISNEAKLSQRLMAELVSGAMDVAKIANPHLFITTVGNQHVGLLYINGELQAELLPPGHHAWWKTGRMFATAIVDLRLQTLEVSGQEILTQDKVPLRLNLTAGFRITDPVQAKTQLADINGFLYKELQFALRGAVGTRTLDALLDDKTAIDSSVADHILSKTAAYGIEVESVGVKDIILPGEIKTILCQVVEAEKSAQANVIRRREETSATRSMLNTAKVMENNPVALRLKELEVLERIAEKIDRINVNGGVESILTEIIKLDRQ
ncbi:MAG: SPFH domain-containing protein [Leptolyngbyaceae bacterium]|nr:SPFH domain-containing protein [Leptolyngbyaceae bacterium]